MQGNEAARQVSQEVLYLSMHSNEVHMAQRYLASMLAIVEKHCIGKGNAYPEICPMNLTSQSGQFPGQAPLFWSPESLSAKH